MHAVIRHYTGAAPLIAAMEREARDVERLLATVPGFVTYHAVRAGDTLVTTTVCRDRAGTDETTRRAGEWLREALPPGDVVAPTITQGEVFLDFSAPQTLGAGTVRT